VSVTVVIPAKTGSGLQWAQGTIYSMRVQIPPWEEAILRGNGRPRDPAKTAEPIKMLFGLWAGLGWAQEIMLEVGSRWEGVI